MLPLVLSMHVLGPQVCPSMLPASHGGGARRQSQAIGAGRWPSHAVQIARFPPAQLCHLFRRTGLLEEAFRSASARPLRACEPPATAASSAAAQGNDFALTHANVAEHSVIERCKQIQDGLSLARPIGSPSPPHEMAQAPSAPRRTRDDGRLVSHVILLLPLHQTGPSMRRHERRPLASPFTLS